MKLEEIPAELRKASIPALAGAAARLVRNGQLSGETALCLIIWPDSRDMQHYLRGQRQDKAAEYLNDQMVA